MKKIELHLHFDGSLNIKHANELMGMDVSRRLIGRGSDNLDDYLDSFNLPIELLQEYNNIRDFAYLLGKDLEKDNVIYAEVRFCPLNHGEKISIDRVIMAIKEGFSKVSTVKVNLIFCMKREFSYEKNHKVVEYARKYLGNGVVGIDIAGDEAAYKTSSFEGLFKEAKDYGIPITIHAGEADDYTSIDSAIKFGARRIGHGVKSIESSETINNLIKNNILLEICPTSNLDTNIYEDMREHDIKKLIGLGVKVCINTDNRTVSDTTLEREYGLLRDAFNFTDDDFLKFNMNAIDGAFISEEEKEELRIKLVN